MEHDNAPAWTWQSFGISTHPLLKRPGFDLLFDIHADASQWAVGGCVIHEWDDQPQLVSRYGHKPSGGEVRLSATEIEALADVEAIKAFHLCVYGRIFHIYVAHKPIVYNFKR